MCLFIAATQPGHIFIYNCNTLVGVKYKSQNVSLRKVAVTCFCCFVKTLILFRNGDIREVGGEAEGKDAWSVTV